MTFTANVGTAAAFENLTFNNMTAGPNTFGTLNFDTKAGAAFINLIGEAAPHTSLTKINVAGTNFFGLNVTDAGGTLATIATAIDATNNSAGVLITGLGASAHTLTGGSGDDTFLFAGNLGTTDTVTGNNNTTSVGDTIGANGATLAAVTAAAKPTVTGIERLFIQDDIGGAGTVVNAALFGGAVSNFLLADQGAAGITALTVNGLTAGTSAAPNNFRFNGDLGANTGVLTFNINNAQDAGTVNYATLDMRGGATTATSAIVLNGVENITVDTSNATGEQTFNITDAALQSLTVKGGQNVVLNGAALGSGVTTIDATGLTGAALLNVQLSAAATSGAAINTAGGADVIIGSQLNDTINTFGGADTITGMGGADKMNGGTGVDTFIYTAGVETGVATFGTATTSTATLDILTVNTGDLINITAVDGATADALLGTLQVAGNLSNTLAGTTTVQRVLGVYDATANTFTVGVTGANAVLLGWDSNEATTEVDHSIILVGVTDVTDIAAGVITV